MHTNSHKDRHSNLNKSLRTNKSYSILLLLPNQIHMCQAMRTWDLTWRTDLGLRVSEEGKKLPIYDGLWRIDDKYIHICFIHVLTTSLDDDVTAIKFTGNLFSPIFIAKAAALTKSILKPLYPFYRGIYSHKVITKKIWLLEQSTSSI